MKKLILFSVFLFITTGLYGQSFTNVTATLQDSGGQAWSNATVSAALQGPFGVPGGLFNQGHGITNTTLTTQADAAGTFNLTMDDVLKITPAGSKWVFTLCPNATVANCTTVSVAVTGVSLNLTAVLNAALQLPFVNAAPSLTRAYSDAEVNGGNGTLYWRTSDNTLRGCQALPNGTCTWVPVGGAGSFVAAGNLVGSPSVQSLFSMGPYSGLIAGNIAPICIVDGSPLAGHFQTIKACMTYLSGLGLTGGQIWSFVPEVFTCGYFSLSNFRGTVYLAANISNVTGNPTQNTSPPSIYLADCPIIVPSNLKLIGLNTQVRQSVGISGGTTISFTANYPSALGTPALITPTCINDPANGTLTNNGGNPYFVQVDESNNLQGSANNGNANSPPGHSAVRAEMAVTCSNGTSTQAIRIPSPAPLTSSNTQLNAQDVGVYSSLSSGQEQQNQVGTDLICPNGAGVVDSRGCNGFTGNIEITAIPTAGTQKRLPPCYRANNNDTSTVVADCSNPLVYFGTGVPGVDSNGFDSLLSRLSLYGSPTNNNAPLSNEPAIAWLNANIQENGGLDDVLFTGAFGANGTGVMIYDGWESGNSYLGHVHIPSNAGPNTGNFIDVIIDARPGGNGGPKLIYDISLNGGGTTGGSPTSAYRMLVTGGQSNTLMYGIHCEADQDCILADNKGGGMFNFSSSTVPLNFYSLHMTVTADPATCSYQNKQGDTHPTFHDDLTNMTVVPGQGFGSMVCAKDYGSRGVDTGYLSEGTVSQGVTVNLIGKLAASGKFTLASTADTNVHGIAPYTVGAGVLKHSELAVSGFVQCVAGNTVAGGELVGIGKTTNGTCDSLGTNDQAAVSTQTQIVGRSASSGTVLAGSLVNVAVFGPGIFGARQNIYSCGTTTSCAGTAITGGMTIIGSAPLVSGTPSTATVTGISPAFTSSSTYFCTLTDRTNAANNLLKFTPVSGTSFTITGPNTITDVIAYTCVGN